MWGALTTQRRSGLCAQLAKAANRVEEVAEQAGEAAGLATLEALKWLGTSRLVQKIGQTITDKAITKFVETKTTVVARALRIIGIWLCACDGTLDTCPCFRDFAMGQTKEWIKANLESHLTNLIATDH